MNQVKVGSSKWLGVGLGPVKTYDDASYADAEGFMYDPYGHCWWSRASNATRNTPQYSHFKVSECEIDMILDFGGRSWSICMVGHNDDTRTKRFTNLNLPDKALVPHFNMYYDNTELRIAKIPPSLFGVEQKGIFGSV